VGRGPGVQHTVDHDLDHEQHVEHGFWRIVYHQQSFGLDHIDDHRDVEHHLVDDDHHCARLDNDHAAPLTSRLDELRTEPRDLGLF
jgi:hypothetical protein